MNKSASHTPHIFQKVKIVATLGPASDTPEMILKLARTGVNVFRLNLSHYSIEKSLQSIKNIHRAEKILKAPIGILGDLAGPKIRIGDVPKGVKLQTGQKITIVSHAGKDSRALTVNFPKILKSLERGAEIYLGDGLIKLEVIKKTPGGVITRVLVGGTLASRMGFSAQGLALARFKLSRKDIGDIAEMTRAGITALAVSFVQSARDIEAVKKLLPLKNRPMVIAKI
jgi:pyruvate kinase